MMKFSYQNIKEEPASSTSFRDLLLGFLAFIMIILVIILFIINPESKEEKELESFNDVGDLTIEIFWQDESPSDVDLWVKVAQEPQAIGYTHRNGKYLNLLRDDLGHKNDVSGKNREIIASRGIPKGPWLVNVHIFDKRSWKPTIIVRVVIRVNLISKVGTSSQKDLLARDLYFTQDGQELTAFSFMLDDNGNLIQESVNYKQVPLIKRARRGGMSPSNPRGTL